ncbi:MAG TPA: hypothetical protein PKE29_14155 [Phycisphaerales bacterium]|nr:hypothetical protein [Phycisphaerales bacterium]
MKTPTHALAAAALLSLLFTLNACARSRADAIRDHASVVERKLETERDRVLSRDLPPGTRDLSLSHLQALRAGLSVARVSLASVPLLLTDDTHRQIGYSVLDEAIGTIDWNIPIYQQSAPNARAFPSLFSPQLGLDFAAIQSGSRPGQPGPGAGVRPPGIAR